MKGFLRKLHRWLGLSVGVWAAVTGVTGSLLVFDDELDAMLHPSLLTVAARPMDRDIDGAVASVQAEYPGEPVLAMRLPREPDEPLVLRIGAERITDVYVDPYTAEILGSRPEHGGFFGFLWDLHVHLLAGETGETVAGFLGLALIAMLISGLVLWWPSRRALARALSVNWKAGGRARMYDLHRVAGVLAMPLLLVVVVTGAMLVFHSVVTSALVAAFGGPPLAPPPAVRASAGRDMAPVSEWLRRADASLPEAQPVSITFPRDTETAAVVRQRFASNPHPNGRSFVAVDPYTGEVLSVHDWRAAGGGVRVSDYKYPLHIGDAFGLPGRILVLITGVTPLLLLFTGGYLWVRKRRRRRIRRVSRVARREEMSRA